MHDPQASQLHKGLGGSSGSGEYRLLEVPERTGSPNRRSHTEERHGWNAVGMKSQGGGEEGRGRREGVEAETTMRRAGIWRPQAAHLQLERCTQHYWCSFCQLTTAGLAAIGFFSNEFCHLLISRPEYTEWLKWSDCVGDATLFRRKQEAAQGPE